MKQLKVAAEKGDAQAQFNLGVMFNRRVDDNEHPASGHRAEAMKWFLQAARQGFPMAQQQMAELLCESSSATEWVEACAWLIRARANSVGAHQEQAKKRLASLSATLTSSQSDEAERLARRALAIDEECFGRGHPKVAVRLNILARLWQRPDRLAQAESSIRRSLAILESSFGPGHPRVAASLSNLAIVLHQMNRLAEAEPVLRRVLTIDEQSYGPEHITVARDLNNLAGLLECTDSSADAEPLYRRAQSIFENNLGADHPDVGTSLNNLAQSLKKLDRLTEAEPVLLRAVQIFLKFTRATRQLDPRLQVAVNNYGRLLEAMGRSREQIYTAIREIAPGCSPG